MKSKKVIDYISINDDFWIQFKSHLISFGFNGLPKGVHFTIGFDKRSTDINFHVTKNHSNQNDKPQIKVVLIDKQHLEEIVPSLTISLFNLILRPFDFNYFKNKENDDGFNFISFEDLETSELSALVEQGFIDSFKDISRFKRKTRLKIKGDVGKRIELLANSEDLQKSIQGRITGLNSAEKYGTKFDGGILISDNKSIQVMRINQDWYIFDFDLNPLEFLCGFVDSKIARHLIWKTKKAIVRVKNATCYADTEKFNTPIRLIQKN